MKKVNDECTGEHQATKRNSYKEKIIEIVETIESPAILNSIYSFAMGILSMKEK